MDQLRELAAGGSVGSSLAAEMIQIRQEYAAGDLDKDEYTWLLNEIAEVRAADELAGDEAICRYIVAAATTLASIV
jgi:hypothetical protein